MYRCSLFHNLNFNTVAVCVCDPTRLTLDTLGKIPKIEDVVRLGWCGQQVQAQTVVDLHGRVHNLGGAVFHLLGKLTQETVQDGLQAGEEGSREV